MLFRSASASFCIDLYDTDVNFWNGNTWADRSIAFPSAEGILPGLEGLAGAASCVSRTFCAASGTANPTPLLWNGHSWTVSQTAGGGGLPQQFEISCASRTLCQAVLSGGYVATWNGKVWSGPALVGSPVQNVSCSYTGWCMALSSQGYAYTYASNGGSAGPSTGATAAEAAIA